MHMRVLFRVAEYPPWPGDDFTVFVHCPLSSENELEKVFGQKKLDSGQWTVDSGQPTVGRTEQ